MVEGPDLQGGVAIRIVTCFTKGEKCCLAVPILYLGGLVPDSQEIPDIQRGK